MQFIFLSNLQIGKALKAQLRLDRKTVATLGEGSLFSHLKQRLSSEFAYLQAHVETVAATGDIQKSEYLSVGPETTVLTID